MSTHKYINRICCVVLAVSLIITVLFMNADKLGVKAVENVKEYQSTLFDTSKVHTINIVMDDWDGFLEKALEKQYAKCDVVIDGEKVSNVGIRAKGNSSLTQVSASNSDRYSLKIEFDHYEKAQLYKGLDKLSLNNIIQDNTYMKDFLCYQLMSKMNVASPLCSYIQVSVNGKEFGLYLAVEALEESFLERNYGSNYGELYKPESDDQMGGAGKGAMGAKNGNNNANADNNENNGNQQAQGERPELPGGNGQNGGPQGNPPGGNNQQGNPFGGPPPQDMNPEADNNGENENNNNADENQNAGGQPDNLRGGGSSGIQGETLKYVDNDYDSYSYIFDNGVTKISKKDRSKIINALKNISENKNLESSIDIEQTIRYFVVHNFVLNFDSYTGSIMHNYYLYENKGQLTMLPWDYNLAFNSFMANISTENLINYPIDTPVSVGTVESRPMLSWIFENEEYTQQYHEIFSDLIHNVFDSGEFADIIDSTKKLISPYVQSDPTKFCTYDEFELGIDTLKQFCLLRAESISGQLKGTIGSTSDGQQDKANFVEAGDLDVLNMGSENSMKQDGNRQQMAQDQFGQQGGGNAQQNEGNAQADGNQSKNAQSDAAQGDVAGNGNPGANMQPANGENQAGGGKQIANGAKQSSGSTSISMNDAILLGVCAGVLILGIAFAVLFKKRKY